MATTQTKFVTPDNFIRSGRGDVVEWVGTITGDTAYPTGGYLLTAALFGLDSIQFVHVNAYTNIAQKAAVWLPTTNAIKIWVDAAGTWTEAANASDQSLVILPIRVVGRSKSA